MHGFLEAQQQGHHHRAAAGQQAAVGQRQAAEQEGQQQGDLAGLAVIAAVAQGDHVGGGAEDRQGQQQGDPYPRAEMAGEQGGEAAEQADQAEGAHSGGELVVLAVARAPAALGADQQADGQRAGQIQQDIEVGGHRRFPGGCMPLSLSATSGTAAPGVAAGVSAASGGG
ncbi:hypothetical protein D3C80_1192060 [compost metagenome]